MSEVPEHEPEPRVSAWQIGILPILTLTTLIAIYFSATQFANWRATPLWLQISFAANAIFWIVLLVLRSSFLLRRYRRRRQRDVRHREQLETWLEQRGGDREEDGPGEVRPRGDAS